MIQNQAFSASNCLPSAPLFAGLVLLHAGIALAANSEAALHTRMLSAKEIRELAGGIPQTAPPPRDEDGDGGGDPS